MDYFSAVCALRTCHTPISSYVPSLKVLYWVCICLFYTQQTLQTWSQLMISIYTRLPQWLWLAVTTWILHYRCGSWDDSKQSHAEQWPDEVAQTMVTFCLATVDHHCSSDPSWSQLVITCACLAARFRWISALRSTFLLSVHRYSAAFVRCKESDIHLTHGPRRL